MIALYYFRHAKTLPFATKKYLCSSISLIDDTNTERLVVDADWRSNAGRYWPVFDQRFDSFDISPAFRQECYDGMA